MSETREYSCQLPCITCPGCYVQSWKPKDLNKLLTGNGAFEWLHCAAKKVYRPTFNDNFNRNLPIPVIFDTVINEWMRHAAARLTPIGRDTQLFLSLPATSGNFSWIPKTANRTRRFSMIRILYLLLRLSPTFRLIRGTAESTVWGKFKVWASRVMKKIHLARKNKTN